MPEIRLSLSHKLNKIIAKLAMDVGIKKTEYLRYIIINHIKWEQKKKTKSSQEDQ